MTETKEKVFTYILRNKFICMDYSNIKEFRDTYKHYMDLMDKWMEDGIKILDNGGVADDYATFYTNDPKIAERYGFEEEEYEDV